MNSAKIELFTDDGWTAIEGIKEVTLPPLSVQADFVDIGADFDPSTDLSISFPVTFDVFTPLFPTMYLLNVGLEFMGLMRMTRFDADTGDAFYELLWLTRDAEGAD